MESLSIDVRPFLTRFAHHPSLLRTLVGFAGTIYSFPDKFRLYLQSYFPTFICKVTFPDKAVFMQYYPEK